MPLRYYANAPATTLTTSCTAAATSIIVASTSGFPIQYPYTLIIDKGTISEEAVSVTAAAGTTLTVTRGFDSTPAFAHTIGASVEHGIVAADIRETNAHVNASTAVHGITGAVVGTTDSQHLTNKTAATPTTSDDSTKVATTAFVKAALLAMNPVGTILFNATGTNPGTYIGGTWTAWGQGRVPVGVDTSQSEFNLVEETGGAKTHTLTTAEMPVHSHGIEDSTHTHGINDPSHAHAQNVSANPGTGGSGVRVDYDGDGSGSSAYPQGIITDGAFTGISIQASFANIATHNAGSGSAHNNLQPYITCYMFKRTA